MNDKYFQAWLKKALSGKLPYKKAKKNPSALVNKDKKSLWVEVKGVQIHKKSPRAKILRGGKCSPK